MPVRFVRGTRTKHRPSFGRRARAAEQWSSVPEEKLELVLLEAVMKSLRTGFAAGTVAQWDPALSSARTRIPMKSRR
jgi:hypothetical protein